MTPSTPGEPGWRDSPAGRAGHHTHPYAPPRGLPPCAGPSRPETAPLRRRFLRTDALRLEAAIGGLRATGAAAYGFAADVTDPARLGSAVEQGAEALGGLDLLVANAGGSSGGDLLDSTPEDWARTYAVNVLHAAHAVRTAVPHLERSGGAAVLVSLQQVTDVACFLLSGRASGINGADICVDGAQDRPSDLRFFP
ncbi:MAG: 3-oxoacyl-[acyl-carrier protein] reductase [Streptosporangiaceae bacterium]|jgi:hypothetical protein|nr:3-oxoacyl-[acyl-carrier protein] reductase [Streptosporangiaceae bacterium]